MKNQYTLFALLGILLLGAALKAQGERITHYDVTIEVNRDASLTVTEEIRAIARGESIKRGIVRKLPIEYGVREIPYEILDIRRDGQAEPYHIKRKDGSLSIYIGKKRVKIPPGAYTYTIRYRALWGVRRHREFEEVYWNAIGSDWAFPIDTALCRLILPEGTKATQAFAYTGRYRSRDLGEAKGQGEFNRITFTPNRPLMPEEGLTIAARMDQNTIGIPETERITNYEVDVVVQTDRAVVVTEKIRVNNLGRHFRRGIVRELPVWKPGRFLKKMRYQGLEVSMDGQAVPFQAKRQGSSFLIYIGEELDIPPGSNEYTIRYRVPDEVRLYPDMDEISWEALGNAWAFPADTVRCTVQLPAGATVRQAAAGTRAASRQFFTCETAYSADSSAITFYPAFSFFPYENQTVTVGMDKDVVEPPTYLERYGIVFLLGAGTILLLLYYLATVIGYGIDPPKPTADPVSEAPDNLSPASLGYIRKEKYDPDLFTASLIHLAVKGYVQIEKVEEQGFLGKKKTYCLHCLNRDLSQLPREERALMGCLFVEGNIVEINSGAHHHLLSEAYILHKNTLEDQHQAFLTAGDNRAFLRFPIALALLLGIAAVALLARQIILVGGHRNSWTILILLVVALVFIAFPKIPQTLFLNLVAQNFLPVVILAIVGAAYLVWNWDRIDWPGAVLAPAKESLTELWPKLLDEYLNFTVLAAFVLFSLISMAIYTYLIKKPSVAKLALQARIEGFWMYLSTAEKDRLEWSAPLEKTPAVFEAMLPFAFAAGLANRWPELFQDTLAGAGYQVQWGDGFDAFDHNDFADDFCGTMKNACISASSWGSDGGGAVGGGDGGGGGGGW